MSPFDAAGSIVTATLSFLRYSIAPCSAFSQSYRTFVFRTFVLHTHVRSSTKCRLSILQAVSLRRRFLFYDIRLLLAPHSRNRTEHSYSGLSSYILMFVHPPNVAFRYCRQYRYGDAWWIISLKLSIRRVLPIFTAIAQSMFPSITSIDCIVSTSTIST